MMLWKKQALLLVGALALVGVAMLIKPDIPPAHTVSSEPTGHATGMAGITEQSNEAQGALNVSAQDHHAGDLPSDPYADERQDQIQVTPLPDFKRPDMLGTLSPEEVAENHAFGQLATVNGRLALNNKTKNILMNLFYDLPSEEIEASSPRIREAAALHLDQASVEEFMVLVDEFADYFATLEQLDAKLNQGEIVMSPEEAARQRRQVEDEAFGQEKAAQLFAGTRALEEAIALDRQRYQGQALTDEEKARLMARYQAIMAQYGM